MTSPKRKDAQSETAQSPEGHLPRLMGEQFGQLLVTAVGFLDRLVLTGLLFRIWGPERFEHWSAILAFAGFGSLFEFGFNLYYNNRITFETERGETDAARATLYEANSVFALCATGGFAAMALLALTTGLTGVAATSTNVLATILLCGGATLRLLTTGMNAQYRANRAYSRFAMISALGELLRVVAIAVAVLAGADILVAAVASFVAQMLMPVATVIWDTRRRYAPHHLGLRLPRGESLRDALSMSGAYFGQLLPVILIGAAPILVLQAMPLQTGVLASFVLVRTLANLARTPLQSFGIVIGQECGRRIAVGDTAGALTALSGGARLFAVLSGLACGVVAIGGPAIVRLWTGDPAVFTLPLALAAMAPMLLGAVSILAHNVLVASNAPYLALVARWLQLGITILAWFVVPVEEAGLRMMLALAVGEVAGYLPMAYVAMLRLIPGSGFGFHIGYTLLTLLSAAVAAGLSQGALRLIPPNGLWQCVAALGMAGLGCLIWAALTALDPATRQRTIDTTRQRVFGRNT
jgi:hypothetical protein